MEVISKGYFVF